MGISLAPSKTPTVKQQQQAAAARKQPQQLQAGAGLHSQHSIDDALHDLHALQLSPRSSAAAAAAGVAASDASVHGSVYSEEPSEASAAGAKGKVPWRPLADYKLEPDLARCVRLHSRGYYLQGIVWRHIKGHTHTDKTHQGALSSCQWHQCLDYVGAQAALAEPVLVCMRHAFLSSLCKDCHVFHCVCREVETATAAEVSNGSASRRGLHLVVMGHVDAGKSTLMGRLLHDLGQVSQKEVHKNQRESAQAGKVRTGGVTTGICSGRPRQIIWSGDCATSRLVLAQCAPKHV